MLLEHKPRDRDAEKLIARHHRPVPHVQEGQWLGTQQAVHAMMDVSDGIDSDLKRIMEKSGCGMDIRLDGLPLSDELQRVCGHYKWDARELAAAAGEDYCLLLTVAPGGFSELATDFSDKFQCPLFLIGEVTGNADSLLYLVKGKPHRFEKRGWDHFKTGAKANI